MNQDKIKHMYVQYVQHIIREMNDTCFGYTFGTCMDGKPRISKRMIPVNWAMCPDMLLPDLVWVDASWTPKELTLPPPPQYSWSATYFHTWYNTMLHSAELSSHPTCLFQGENRPAYFFCQTEIHLLNCDQTIPATWELYWAENKYLLVWHVYVIPYLTNSD